MFATQSDEQLFEEPKGNYVNLRDDLLADNCGGLEEKGVKKLKRSINEVKKNGGGNSEAKKMMRRDSERQRRKEMAALYASLRSLLPLEYVKGKRAVCDHMEQAVNYIKYTQRKIEETKMRRNKLKKCVDDSSLKGKRVVCDHMEQAVNCIKDTQRKIEETKMRRNKLKKCVDDSSVKVNLLGYDGMEILIATTEECFPLSKVLEYLLGLELSVTTCESTRSHQYSLHKLHIELNEIKSIDISELQQRLVNLIKVS